MATDRNALLALYHSAAGENWFNKDNWGTDAELSRWHGVNANDEGRVVVLYLVHNNLQGSLPPELGGLGALRGLNLSENALSGPIPPELGNLAELRKLLLGENQLNGCIPPQLGNLIVVERLDLGGNKFDGPIPEELGALGELKGLDLSGNQLTGPIPGTIGKLSKLKELVLNNNKLTGCVPPGLGQVRGLRVLNLSSNDLSAFWNHGTDVANDAELNGCAGGVSIPRELGHLLALLSKLEGIGKLSIGENPWKEPPEAVVGKGTPAVSGYFADLFAEGVTVRRNMIKVVLVGQAGAGKTSIRQSLRNGRPTPTSGPKESTVQIDVEEMEMDVDGVSLRVYDCAGQVAYTGLLQMFLSPRAVSLLVCNIGAFGQRDACSSDRHQLKQDLVKLQELRVCDWLRSLSFRIPDSDVVVVATKCDLVDGMAADLAGRMERAIRKWLENWRGARMTAARVEDGVSLTSCVATSPPTQEGGAALGTRKKPEGSKWACDWREHVNDDSPPSLLDRIMYSSEGHLRGAAMVLPRSWDIALEVLEALGSGRDPVESVRKKMLYAEGPESGKRVAPTTAELHRGVEGLTLADLSEKWTGVVKALKRKGVDVVNPGHALEGALSIREYEGSLVRHDTYVFLDVTWLAQILKPLLNHRDDEDPFCGSVSLGDTGITLDDDEHIASWKRLKQDGVLEPALARALWPDGLSDYVLPTLDSLGLTHPLDGDISTGLVVLLRLGKKRPKGVGKELDDFRRNHTAVLSVTWKIFMGVPPGAIEKVLTRCCGIGALRTFWRFGVLIQGGFGAVTAGKTFALLMEYSHDKTEIDVKVYGNIGTAAPWAALSFGLSAVRMMCSEFPGLRWRASLQCPQHEQEMQITHAATRPGDKFLLGKTCSLCSSETGGLGAVATDLLEMIDVSKGRGEIFTETHGRLVELQHLYPVLRPEASSSSQTEQTDHRFDLWLSGMKEELEGLITRARKVAVGEGGGDGAKAGADREDASGVSDEVAKLQRLVGDLQQRLGQQHQEVRVWLGAVDKRLKVAVDADTGAMEKQDFLVAMLMAVRREGFDTPRQACVLPPWKFAQAHGLSDDEQSPELWVTRLQEWREDDFSEGKGFFKKKKRLFLVCAVTHRLVPCGPSGQGYDIQQARTWFRTSIGVATFALQVVCSTLAAMAVAPLAGGGAAIEATVSAAMGAFESLLQARVEGLAATDDGSPVNAGSQVSQLEGGAYASLREFVHGVEDAARVEMAKADKRRRAPSGSYKFVFFSQVMVQVQRRDGDAAVQWVLKGQEDAWYGAKKPAPAW